MRLAVMQPVGLWTDECVTFWAAAAPSWLDVCRRSLGYTTHPPLYYLLIHVQLALFGHSELVLRLPSLVAGMLAPGAAFLALRRLSGRNDVAVLTALLAAVDPHQVACSQIARPYALAVLLTYVSVWLFAGLLRGPATWRWIVWAVCHAALAQCNYLFAGLAIVQAVVYLVIHRRQRPLLRAAIVGLGAWVLLMAPWVPHMWRLYGRGPTLIFRDVPTLRDLLPTWFGWVLLVWIAAAIVGIVWAWVRRDRLWPFDTGPAGVGRRAALTLIAWYVLPVGMLFLVGRLTWLRVCHARYLTAYVAALPALGAWLFAIIRVRWRRWTAVGAMLVALAVTRYGHFRTHELRWAYEDWGKPARAVCAAARPGDVVLFNAGLVEARHVHLRQDDPVFSSYLQAPLAGLYGRPRVPVIHLGHELHPDSPSQNYMNRVVLPQIAKARRVWILVRHWRDRRLWPDLAAWIQQVDDRRFCVVDTRRSVGVIVAMVINTRPDDVRLGESVHEDGVAELGDRVEPQEIAVRIRGHWHAPVVLVAHGPRAPLEEVGADGVRARLGLEEWRHRVAQAEQARPFGPEVGQPD